VTDFYSLSGCRDLVFHVMEHQFRLPQIETMLRNAGLVVLDLVEGLGPDVTAAYRRRFPDDPGMLSFHNWDVFEQARPDTFAQMVSIRCRVPGGAGQSAQEA
jgi:hypothetical protein